MAFDKELYWARRNRKVNVGTKKKPIMEHRPLRGQSPVQTENKEPVEVDRRITKKALMNNTKRARKLAVSLEAEGQVSL